MVWPQSMENTCRLTSTNVIHTVCSLGVKWTYNKGIYGLISFQEGFSTERSFCPSGAQKNKIFSANNNSFCYRRAVVNTKPPTRKLQMMMKVFARLYYWPIGRGSIILPSGKGIVNFQAKGGGGGLLLYAFLRGGFLEHIFRTGPFRIYCTKLVEDRLGSKF